jgi:hypothetical protein
MMQVNAIKPSKIVEMTPDVYHTSPPVLLSIVRTMKLLVAEGTDRPNRRSIFAKMGATVVNPLFERLWMEPQMTSGIGKLAR